MQVLHRNLQVADFCDKLKKASVLSAFANTLLIVLPVSIILPVSTDAAAQTGTNVSGVSGKVYNIPSNIASDCSVDVTEAINNWVTSVPNGTAGKPSILKFGKNKCYRVAGSIGSPYDESPAGYQRSYLVFEGNGSTIDGSKDLPPTYTNRDGIALTYSNNIIIQNLTIKGNDNGTYTSSTGQLYNNPCNIPFGDTTTSCHIGEVTAGYYSEREAQHGIGIFSSNHITVQNNNIYNVFGDGVTVAQPFMSSYVVIDHNVIDGTGRMGVGVTSADHVQITNNTFDRISYHVVDLENEVQQLTNITFSGNTTKRMYLGVISAATAQTGVCLRSNNVISNNVMQVAGVTTFPPLIFQQDMNQCTPGDGLTITGNTLITYYGYESVYIEGWNNVKVDNNRLIQASINVSPIRFKYIGGNTPEANNNDMRENPYIYSLDDINDTYSPAFNNVPGVNACGNTTSVGPDQLTAC